MRSSGGGDSQIVLVYRWNPVLGYLERMKVGSWRHIVIEFLYVVAFVLSILMMLFSTLAGKDREQTFILLAIYFAVVAILTRV